MQAIFDEVRAAKIGESWPCRTGCGTISPMTDTPVAIITGASSGIGKALALTYAQSGYHVVLAARREDRLLALADTLRSVSPLGTRAASVRATDVTDAEQVQAMVDHAMNVGGRIDVLVNNAGFGQFGRVWELAEADLRTIFEVNFFGAFHACKAVTPIMLAQGEGHIFNISSVIGRAGSPFHGSYSATKFALSGLTESLRVELLGTGVHATEVCPALTDTEFFDHVVDGEPRDRSDFLRKKKKMSPMKVAKRIVARTGKRTPRLVFTVGGRLLIAIMALWPRLGDRLLKVYRDDLLKCLTDDDVTQSRDN
jgi:short-subunit dehydrogenase